MAHTSCLITPWEYEWFYLFSCRTAFIVWNVKWERWAQVRFPARLSRPDIKKEETSQYLEEEPAEPYCSGAWCLGAQGVLLMDWKPLVTKAWHRGPQPFWTSAHDQDWREDCLMPSDSQRCIDGIKSPKCLLVEASNFLFWNLSSKFFIALSNSTLIHSK